MNTQITRVAAVDAAALAVLACGVALLRSPGHESEQRRRRRSRQA
ncbi:hypothetical protein [Tomitella gaofuii]|nr:hypothetical protein [Tomitella gaofuii]